MQTTEELLHSPEYFLCEARNCRMSKQICVKRRGIGKKIRAVFGVKKTTYRMRMSFSTGGMDDHLATQVKLSLVDCKNCLQGARIEEEVINGVRQNRRKDLA